MNDEKAIDIKTKIKNIKSTNLKRFYTKHKGKFKIIFILLVIIIICLILDIPVNGDYPEKDTTNNLKKDTTNNLKKDTNNNLEKDTNNNLEKDTNNNNSNYEFKKVMSLFGFFSNMLIVALLISITGVETYFSRNELDNARKETVELGTQKVDEKTQNINTIATNEEKKLKLESIVNKIKNFSSLLKNYNPSKIHVTKGSSNSAEFSQIFGDNQKDAKIKEVYEYLDIIKFAFKYDTSLDEEFLIELLQDLDKI